MTTQLERDIGRMEGELQAVKERLEKIDTVLERIDSRLARIEATESERKGAWRSIVAISSLVSALVVAAFKYLFH